MFEKFTSENFEGFHQRYKGTYGHFTRKGKQTLVRLIEVTRREVKFEDADKMGYILNADSDEEGTGFTFLPLRCSYHNVKEGGPLLIGRVPARQYSRGICDKNTYIATLNGGRLPVDFTTLTSLFSNNPTPLEMYKRLVENIDSPTSLFKYPAGVAISPQFALDVVANHIYCFGQVIGSCKWAVDKDKFIIKLNDVGLWGQEVRDALRRSELKGEVK